VDYQLAELDTTNLNKGLIRNDSLIWIAANIKKDHQILGYQKSNTNSQRLLLLSVFTSDIETSDGKYKWGANYESSKMGDLSLTYLGDKDDFLIVGVHKVGILVDTVYMERKYFNFEESACND
jgi:hypothetical protein